MFCNGKYATCEKAFALVWISHTTVVLSRCYMPSMSAAHRCMYTSPICSRRVGLCGSPVGGRHTTVQPQSPRTGAPCSGPERQQRAALLPSLSQEWQRI